MYQAKYFKKKNVKYKTYKNVRTSNNNHWNSYPKVSEGAESYIFGQPANQSASQRSKNIRCGPSAFPRHKKSFTFENIIAVYMCFMFLLQMSLEKASFWQTTKVLLRTSVKQHKKEYKNYDTVFKSEGCLVSRKGGGPKSYIFGPLAGWLAGWLAKNIRFCPLRKFWVWISFVFDRCPCVLISFLYLCYVILCVLCCFYILLDTLAHLS